MLRTYVEAYTYHLLLPRLIIVRPRKSIYQECARDLFGRDRDETRDVNVRDQDEPETRRCESETRLRPRRYKLPRRLVKSSKQSPQVAAYRDNWTGIRANHVAFIIWAFYGLVNAVYRMWYWFLSCTSMLLPLLAQIWTDFYSTVCLCVPLWRR